MKKKVPQVLKKKQRKADRVATEPDFAYENIPFQISNSPQGVPDLDHSGFPCFWRITPSLVQDVIVTSVNFKQGLADILCKDQYNIHQLTVPLTSIVINGCVKFDTNEHFYRNHAVPISEQLFANLDKQLTEKLQKQLNQPFLDSKYQMLKNDVVKDFRKIARDQFSRFVINEVSVGALVTFNQPVTSQVFGKLPVGTAKQAFKLSTSFGYQFQLDQKLNSLFDDILAKKLSAASFQSQIDVIITELVAPLQYPNQLALQYQAQSRLHYCFFDCCHDLLQCYVAPQPFDIVQFKVAPVHKIFRVNYQLMVTQREIEVVYDDTRALVDNFCAQVQRYFGFPTSTLLPQLKHQFPESAYSYADIEVLEKDNVDFNYKAYTPGQLEVMRSNAQQNLTPTNAFHIQLSDFGHSSELSSFHKNLEAILRSNRTLLSTELKPLIEIKQKLLGMPVVSTFEEYLSQEVQLMAMLTQLNQILLDFYRFDQEIYYFDIVLDVSKLREQLKLLVQDLTQVAQSHSKNCISRICDQIVFKIATRVDVYSKSPENPQGLISMLNSNNNIKPFMKETINDFYRLLSHFSNEFSPFSEINADFIHNGLDQLVVLYKKRMSQNKFYENKKRVFSKLVLQFTDFQQFYINQLDLMIDNCLKLTVEDIDAEVRNSSLFKRKYKWLFTGLLYKPVNAFFDTKQENFDEFIKQVNQQVGQMDLQKYEDVKLLFTKTSEIDLPCLFKEIQYVLKQMAACQQIAKQWAEILQVECYITIDADSLIKKYNPVYYLLIENELFIQGCNTIKLQSLKDADINTLINQGEDILGNIRFVSDNEQYKTWNDMGSNIIDQTIARMQVLQYLFSIKNSNMADVHFTKLSQMLDVQVSQDLSVSVNDLIKLLNQDQRQFIYDSVLELIDQAQYNDKLVKKIKSFDQILESMKFDLEPYDFIHLKEWKDLQVSTQNFKFVSVNGVEILLQSIDKSLYVISKFISETPIISTQKLCRDCEQQLLHHKQFIISIFRSRIQIKWFCDNYYRFNEDNNKKQLFQFFNLLCISQQYFQQKISQGQTDKLIIKNLLRSQQISTQVQQFDLIQSKILLKSNRINHFLEYKKWSFDQTNSCLLNGNDKIQVPSHLLDLYSTFKNDQSEILKAQQQKCRELIQKGLFSDAILTSHYQILIQEFIMLEVSQLQEIQKILTTINLKGDTLNAIKERVNDFLRNERFKQFLRNYVNVGNYWNGQVIMFETFPFNDQYMGFLEDLIISRSMKVPFLLLGDRICGYTHRDYQRITLFLARMLGLKQIIITLFECDDFDDVLACIGEMIQRGYLIQLSGVEFLSLKSIMKLLNLLNRYLQNEFAPLPPYLQGHVVMYIPMQAYSVEQVMIDIPQLKRILNYFTYKKTGIIFHSIFVEFGKFNSQHVSKPLTYIATYLSNMHFLSPQLPVPITAFLLDRCKEPNSLSVAISTFCYIVDQLSSQKLFDAFRLLVASSFGFPTQQIQQDHSLFKPTSNISVFSDEGNYHFGVLRYYLPLGCVCLLSKSQQMSLLFVQNLKTIGFKLFYVFDQQDLDDQIDSILIDKVNSVIIFVLQDVFGYQAKSLMGNILAFQQINHHLTMSSGRIVDRIGMKAVVILNQFERDDVIQTPISWALRKVRMQPDYFSSSYLVDYFIIKPLRLNQKIYFYSYIHRKDQIKDYLSSEQYFTFISKVQSKDEIQFIEEKTQLYDTASSYLSDLISILVKAVLDSYNIKFDIRGWMIFRSCLIYFLFVVGIIQMDYKKYFDYQVQATEPERYKVRNGNVYISVGNYCFKDQEDIMTMDLIFNQQFINQRKTQKPIFSALTLASIAAIINSFNILFCKYLNTKGHKVSNLFSDIIIILQQNISTLQQYNAQHVIEEISGLQKPDDNFFYLALQKGSQVVVAHEGEDSQNDDFADLVEEQEALQWLDYFYGKNLLDNQYVGLLKTQRTKYNIPLYFDSEQSMSIVYLASIILGHVPVMIAGAPQSGKSTMLSAAVSILNGIVQQQTYVQELSDLSGMDVVESILKRNYMTNSNVLESQVNKVDLHHVRLLIQQTDENQRYEKQDQLYYFLGQKLINLSPLNGAQIKADMFPNSKYYGTAVINHISIVVETNSIPSQLRETQIFIFEMEEQREQTYVDLVQKCESAMAFNDVQQFVKGLFLVQNTVKISFYLILQQMKQYQMYISKEDNSMQKFSLSLFVNALRSIPMISVQILLYIIDEIKTALSVHILQHDSFWGPLDLGYLLEVQQQNPEKYEQIKVSQYTSWEIEVLSARQEYAQNQQEEQPSDEESDNDNVQVQQQYVEDDPEAKAKARLARKEALVLNMLSHQPKFAKQLVLTSDLSEIDPANFELYIDLYQSQCLEIDPTIANRMFVMHIGLQQQLERNSQKLAVYLNAVRCERYDLANALLPTFNIPASVFYAFQMPYEHYFDSVQLLATLGNYTISNQKLFAQVNLKRQENEDVSDVLSTVSSQSSSTTGLSSSMSSSSHSSFASSIHSTTTQRQDFEYNHQKHSRRRRRMLVDTTTLMQSISREAKMQQVQVPGKKVKFDNQLTNALYNCLSQKGEIQATGYAIRAAFCQSLGISPIIALQDLILEEAAQVAPGGTIEASVPDALTIIETFKHLTTDPSKLNQNVEEKLVYRMIQYGIIQDPVDILVVVPLSSLFSNVDNLSLISTIQAVQTGSAIYEIFKEEEIKVIAKLIALSQNISSVLTIQQILAIASRSFSIAIFSDKNQYSDLLIPFSPVSRHSIVEQKMNAFLAGQSDQLQLFPLFNMTRTPCITYKSLHIPLIMETQQDKQQFCETFCKSVVALYQFCEQKCGSNQLNISLNSFSRSCMRLTNRKLKNNIRLIQSLEPILKTLQNMDSLLNSQSYGQNRVEAQHVRDKVFQIKEMLKFDYMRAVTLIKNSAVDGVLLAVRMYYYPFMKLWFNDEVSFEIALGEVLKQERISNYSMSSHVSQDGMANLQRIMSAGQNVLSLEEERYEFVTNVKKNVSGYKSSILGLAAEDMDPIQNFLPLVKQHIIQTNFVAESLIILWARKLRLKFMFISADIGLKIVQAAEIFSQNIEDPNLKLNKPLQKINCCWSLKDFQRAVKNSFENDGPIVFENVGTKHCDIEVVFFFQKLFLMILSNITKTNQLVSISGMKLQLAKPLHRFNIYYIMEQGVEFTYIMSTGLLNQSILDQSVLIQPQFLVNDSFVNFIIDLKNHRRFITHQDMVITLQAEIQSMAQDLSSQQIFQLLNIRIVKQTIIKQLSQFGSFLVTNQYMSAEISGILKVFTFVQDVLNSIKENLDKRFSMYQVVQSTASISVVSQTIATAMTCQMVLISNLSQIIPQVSSIFNDYFLKNLPKYIQQSLKQKASTNILGEMVLQGLPYFVGNILHLVPEDYKEIFKFLSYLYYSIPYGLSKSYDLNMLKIVLQPTQKIQEEKTIQELVFYQNPDGRQPTLQELTPIVFDQHFVLTQSWKSLLIINSIPERYEELYVFFKQNHSMFTKLVLSQSIFDCIIGNYILKLEQLDETKMVVDLFGEEVARSVEKWPLILPTSIQLANFETIFSSLLIGLTFQPLKFYQQLKRYDSFTPISPRDLVNRRETTKQEYYKNYLQQQKYHECFLNSVPTDLYSVAKTALDSSKIVIIYYDQGCAISYFLKILHSSLLHTAPLVFTLKPDVDQFERFSICIDTDYDIKQSLLHLMQMLIDGFRPKHILWVLVPTKWKMKMGYENQQYNNCFTEDLSRFCALSQCETAYVERPRDIVSSMQYLLTLANYIIKSRGQDIMALHYIVIKALYIQLLKFACIQSRGILNFDDNNFVFEIERILTLAASNQFNIIDISSKPPPVCSITCCNCTGGNSDKYVKLGMQKNPRYDKKGIVWKAIITDEYRQLMEIPTKVSINDFINLFEKLRKIQAEVRSKRQDGSLHPAFVNQPFNIISTRYCSMAVAKDFIQLICNDDVKYLDGKPAPIDEPIQEQPNLDILASELRQFLELSLNNKNAPYHVHSFSNLRNQRLIWQQDGVVFFRGVVYYSLFGDILYYYQLFNTQTPHLIEQNWEANRLMVIGLLERPKVKIVYNKAGNLKFTSEPLKSAVIGITDFRLRGASYCLAARTIVDYMVQDDLGYVHEMPIYFVACEPTEEEYDGSFDAEGIPLIPIDFRCSGASDHTFIHIRNQTGAPAVEWKHKGCCFDIGYF